MDMDMDMEGDSLPSLQLGGSGEGAVQAPYCRIMRNIQYYSNFRSAKMFITITRDSAYTRLVYPVQTLNHANLLRVGTTSTQTNLAVRWNGLDVGRRGMLHGAHWRSRPVHWHTLYRRL
jgi:hypothetical protein